MLRHLILSLLLIGTLAARATFAAPGEIENLGSFGGAQASRASDINHAGDVVGTSYTSLAPRAFLRPATGGPAQDLGLMPGAPNNTFGSEARAINNAGVIAGSGLVSSPSTTRHAFIRPASGGALQDLNLSAGFSDVSSINSAGDILALVADGATQYLRIRRADGIVESPGNPAGAAQFYPSSINDDRDIVGYSFGASTGGFIRRASNGVFQQLPTLGGISSRPIGINNAGDIVGSSLTATGAEHAFRISASDGQIRDLGTLPGGVRSVAYDINESGAAVGNSFISASATHAAFWNPDGEIFDLDAWIDQVNPSAGALWTLTEARAINSSGMIVGTGIFNDGAGGLSDGTRAFVLNASAIVPEPAALGVLAALTPMLGRRKSSRRAMLGTSPAPVRA